MKITKDMIAIGSAVLLATVMMTTRAFASDATIVVTGNTAVAENTPGWMFNRDITTSTPFEFNGNAHSIGVGSLYVKPIQNTYPVTDGNDQFIAENFINTPVANVNSISYDFKIGAGGTETQKDHFYMNVYANFGSSDALKNYDCLYHVVPVMGSKDGFTTVTFDPTQQYPVVTSDQSNPSPHTCPAIPAEMDGLSAGSNIRMFALNVGDFTVSDTDLDGYLDNVVVNTDSGVTTYDFEPMVPHTKEDCSGDGWMSFSTPTFKNLGSCISFVENNSSQR